MVTLTKANRLSTISCIYFKLGYSRDCYRYGFAKVYQGYASVTMDNIPCQRWDTSYPHVHKYTHSDYYPDESVEDAGNFCRSPSGAKIPWCYTTGSKRWQYCDIEQCKLLYTNVIIVIIH
jgi:hypothetical protein